MDLASDKGVIVSRDSYSMGRTRPLRGFSVMTVPCYAHMHINAHSDRTGSVPAADSHYQACIR